MSYRIKALPQLRRLSSVAALLAWIAIMGQPSLRGQCGTPTLSTLSQSFPMEGGRLPVVITFPTTPFCPCGWSLRDDSGLPNATSPDGLPSRRDIGSDPANPTECVWDSPWKILANDGPPRSFVIGFYRTGALEQTILIEQGRRRRSVTSRRLCHDLSGHPGDRVRVGQRRTRNRGVGSCFHPVCGGPPERDGSNLRGRTGIHSRSRASPERRHSATR